MNASASAAHPDIMTNNHERLHEAQAAEPGRQIASLRPAMERPGITGAERRELYEEALGIGMSWFIGKEFSEEASEKPSGAGESES